MLFSLITVWSLHCIPRHLQKTWGHLPRAPVTLFPPLLWSSPCFLVTVRRACTFPG